MDLEEFCSRFQCLPELEPGLPDLEEGEALLRDLISDPEWIGDYLKRMILGIDAGELLKTGIWTNEISLYRSPEGKFVVLAYIWDTYVSDPVHDHGSWGLIGVLAGSILETKYRRTDDGLTDGYARLSEDKVISLSPGDTTVVGPLNEGIHRIENSTAALAISVGVYGSSLRKGYVQFYRPERNSVRRVYAPARYKKALAIRALGGFSKSWASDLKPVFASGAEEFLIDEYRYALKRVGTEDGGKSAPSAKH